MSTYTHTHTYNIHKKPLRPVRVNTHENLLWASLNTQGRLLLVPMEMGLGKLRQEEA